jgi:hypothetical protein
MLKSLYDKFAHFAGSFYDWGSVQARKLSNLFRGAQFSSWLTRHTSKPAGLVAIESFMAIALVVYFFFLMLPQRVAPRRIDGNEMNAYLFSYLSDHPYTTNDMIVDFDNWRARLPGPMISGWLYDTCLTANIKLHELKFPISDEFVFGGYKFNINALVFSSYHTAWLLLLFLILILHRKDALFIIPLVFCGLMYNFIIPAGQWFLPWDTPTVFFSPGRASCTTSASLFR